MSYTVDRTGWAPGPWDAEGDQWVGVIWAGGEVPWPLILLRSDIAGCWCGYAGVYREHPLWGVAYDDPRLEPVDVHGGLTFCGDGPLPGQPEYPFWWFGYDCGHYDDVMPGIDAVLARAGGARFVGLEGAFGTYKTTAWNEYEVRALAGQLIALA